MIHALDMTDVRLELGDFTLGPLDLQLDSGKVVGLVGPNGSGKTTTMRTIMGVLDRDRGAIRVCGLSADPWKGAWKEVVGYVPDRPVFYDWMTGHSFSTLVSRFYPKWDHEQAARLAARFQLDLSKPIKRLSTGNRVKLSLVIALAHHPGLALFDEPTAGLDPVVRTEVFDVLAEMLETGSMTILYSTHILDDLHRLADELVFLREGRIQLHVGKDELIDRWRRVQFRLEGEVEDIRGLVEHTRQGRFHQIVSSSGEETAQDLAAKGAESVRASAMTLEEIAVQIMKGGVHGRHDRTPAHDRR